MPDIAPKLPNSAPPRWFWGALILTFALAYQETILDLTRTWWANEDYSHGFIVIPVVIYLIHRKASVEEIWHWRSEPRIEFMGIVGLTLCLISSVLWNLSEIHSFSSLSFLFAIYSSLLFLFGSAPIKRFGWELAFLLFLVPIPSSIYARLTLPLQLITSRLAADLLHFFDFPIFRSGNMLYLKSSTLQVVNACSGLRSIISILALAYVFAIFSFSSWKLRVVLIASAIPMAVLVNIIRVSVLALLSESSTSAFASGYPHILLGLAIFGISAGSLYVVKRLLAWAFVKK